MIDWMRGKLDLFDVRGIIGTIGYHFFFLAPLLHVYLDYWMAYVEHPWDWRTWLGSMAVLNAAGLIVYIVTRRYITGRVSRVQRRSWVPNYPRFYALAFIFVLVASAMQLYLYALHGGIYGYMDAFTYERQAFAGYGWFFMISESAPRITLMIWAIYISRKRVTPSFLIIALVMVGYFVFTMLFGGLRGSRSNTLWAIFYAASVVHVFVRPLPRKVVFAGLIVLMGFMYIYGFYKSQGTEMIRLVKAGQSLEEFEESSGRNIQGVLLGDLARSDVQAFILYRQVTDESVDYGYGRSYVGAAALLIPSSVWPSRPATKVREGTDIQRGSGTYDSGLSVSSRVYGLTGEWMLNFGIILVPMAFILLAYVVGKTHGVFRVLPRNDIRWLLFPLVVNLCFIVLVGDSDNVLFFAVKNCSLPFLLVMCSRNSTGGTRVYSSE